METEEGTSHRMTPRPARSSTAGANSALTGEVLEWDAGAPRARGGDHGGSRVLAAGAAVLAAAALVAGILLFSSKGRTADGGGVARQQNRRRSPS